MTESQETLEHAQLRNHPELVLIALTAREYKPVEIEKIETTSDDANETVID